MTRKQSSAVVRSLNEALRRIPGAARSDLCEQWGDLYRRAPPKNFPRILLELGIAYRLQEKVYGGLSTEHRRQLSEAASPKAPDGRPELRPDTTLVRTWNAVSHTVTVVDKGYAYRGKVYRSLTQIAKVITGTHQSGPKFFGLKSKNLVRQSA